MATSEEAANIHAAEQRTADAETRIANVEAQRLRLEVAKEIGLDPDLASRLVGKTRDELVADAKTLEEFRESVTGSEPVSMNDRIRHAAGRKADPNSRSPKNAAEMNAHIRKAAGR